MFGNGNDSWEEVPSRGALLCFRTPSISCKAGTQREQSGYISGMRCMTLPPRQLELLRDFYSISDTSLYPVTALLLSVCPLRADPSAQTHKPASGALSHTGDDTRCVWVSCTSPSSAAGQCPGRGMLDRRGWPRLAVGTAMLYLSSNTSGGDIDVPSHFGSLLPLLPGYTNCQSRLCLLWLTAVPGNVTLWQVLAKNGAERTCKC